MKTGNAWCLAACAACLLALVGCVQTQDMNEIMRSWEGHHVSELIGNWGPPHQVHDDGQGGKIYTYDYSTTYTTPGSSSTTGNVYTYPDINSSTYYGTTTHSPATTRTYRRYRMFWANSKGIIYRWKWQGR